LAFIGRGTPLVLSSENERRQILEGATNYVLKQILPEAREM
jgi:hypothetical protein